MVDLLEQGASWLCDQRTAFASQSIVYGRGAVAVVLDATLGVTNVEFEEVAGVVEQFTSRDFIVKASDLVLGGAAVEPQRGDRIEITLGGVLCVFEVLAPTGMECWKWSDPYRVAMRIHTKQVQ
jgi:hypothetical protein